MVRTGRLLRFRYFHFERDVVSSRHPRPAPARQTWGHLFGCRPGPEPFLHCSHPSVIGDHYGYSKAEYAPASAIQGIVCDVVESGGVPVAPVVKGNTACGARRLFRRSSRCCTSGTVERKVVSEKSCDCERPVDQKVQVETHNGRYLQDRLHLPDILGRRPRPPVFVSRPWKRPQLSNL